MGECNSKQINNESLRNSMKVIQPQKCIMIQNPPSLVVELSDGTIQRIGMSNKNIIDELKTRISGGLFMGKNNQLYLIVKSGSLNDKNIMEAAHSYHKLGRQKGVIEGEEVALIKEKNSYYLVIKSKPLGKKQTSFVDLVLLGKKMKQKQICWQDLQFTAIVSEIIKKCAHINLTEFTISNILIGTDGSVHLLPVLNAGRKNSYQDIQQLLVQSLFGEVGQQSIDKLEQNSVFKHKSSLGKIEGISYLIGEERKKNQASYSLITNPSLKFIRDYITAYYYKLDIFSPELLDFLILAQQYHQALQLLDEYMVPRDYYNNITDESYRLYLKILQIQTALQPKSIQTASAKKRVSSAAYHLAKVCKLGNKYSQSLKYFNDCFQYRSSQLQDTFYLQMAEVCRALNKNIEAQSSLIQGLNENPYSRILNLQLVVYICDCMRISQAEQQLMKATPIFRTLQMEVSSSKIMLARGMKDSEKREQCIKKAKQSLQRVLLIQYQQQKESNAYAMALYHETLGDCLFQQHNFSSAREQYHISKIMLKNERACGYRLANITAAQANCLLMQGIYDQAINTYNQALSYVSDQCKTLKDSICGNKAIAKIKKGLHSEGRKQIEQILSSTETLIVEKDYNYKFLKNFLSASQTLGNQ